MTDAPERITLYPYTYFNMMDDEGEFDGWTTPNPDDDLEGWDGATQYIRADLHADLLRAADELAGAAQEDLNAWPPALIEGSALDNALSAYNKAKEKLDA